MAFSLLSGLSRFLLEQILSMIEIDARNSTILITLHRVKRDTVNELYGQNLFLDRNKSVSKNLISWLDDGLWELRSVLILWDSTCIMGRPIALF